MSTSQTPTPTGLHRIHLRERQLSKNERNARRKRLQAAEKLTKLGREAGRLFVKRSDLETVNKLGRDQFARLLNMTTTEQLPAALAEYLANHDNFARLLTKPIRRELTERKLSWLSEQFVAGFVEGLLHQRGVEARRLSGEVDKNVKRELEKINPVSPPEFGPAPFRETAFPNYVPPAPSLGSQYVTTQGNSMIAGHFHGLRARRAER